MLRIAPQRALAVIAWTMIVGGSNSLVGSIANVISHRPAIVPFGLVSLALGVGLMRRRAWAMKWSELVLVLSGLGALAVFTILAVEGGNPPMTLSVLSHPVGTVQSYVPITLAAAFAILSFWAYNTLVRDDVRALARS
jgi:hypothetical protein